MTTSMIESPLTNITPEMRACFQALVTGKGAFALFSCFINGEPGATLAAITHHGDEVDITPLFVSITPSMVLVDHEGNTPS